MEYLKEDRMLKFLPDTLEAVRKDLNLEQPGRVAEALDILENWVQMQPHFVKKDFSRAYLERTLMTAKGLVERAKEKIDRLCTFKTLMPEFFEVPDIKKELEPLQDVILVGHLPHMTPDYHRVFLCKMVSDKVDSTTLSRFYKYLVMVSEYLMRTEYCNGFQIVMDYSDSNILSYVTKINLVDLRQIITVMTEGYGCRIKGIHVISASKTIESLTSILKQVFSPKVAGRIHLHKTADSLSEFIPKDILPSNYGGKERSLLQLNKDWLDAMSSKEFLDYVAEMTQAKTNESCRQTNQFNENYLGMPGSFRALTVD